MSEHGTHSRYVGGCRCDDCRKAKAEYQVHYKKYGRTKETRSLFERWTENVIVDEGCWSWIGARNNFGKKPQVGYGALNIGKHAKAGKAHRMAWEFFRGGIPQGLCVLHRCDNPGCVRPSHLFLGTQADNVRDMIEKGRYRGCAKL